MSTAQPLMMRAAGSRPDDWLKAQTQLLQAALPTQDKAEQAQVPLPLVPLTQLSMLQSVLGHTATSATTRAVQIGSALPALAADPSAPQEAWGLAGAATQRWWSVQAQMLKQWTALALEMGQMRKVRTASSYFTMLSDYQQQSQAIVSNHQLGMLEWFDTVYVDTGWWLAQRAQQR